ncbi:MAG: membrane dipeptidase [Thermoleophilaceae bacterium]|nr:membrane dipeptidase [Thermoleophilaceae bacterium]
MRRRGILALCALALALAPGAAYGQSDDSRFALANACHALKGANGKFVAKSGAGYRATGASAADAEPLFLKPTELGKYLLYTRGREFVGAADGKAQTVARPSEATVWTIEGTTGAFKLTNGGRSLGLSGDEAVLMDASQAGTFAFEKAQGCAEYPEAELNASGTPSGGPVPYGEVRGYADAHEHLMAYEFLGGAAHCGKPWDPYGVEYALRDCPDPQDRIYGAASETAYTGRDPNLDRVGWPSFADWPTHDSITREQTYHRWLERAWMGGVRVMVNLLVENEALCKAYPTKKYPSCDESESLRRQAQDMYAFENYIDAQAGGPGKGFFRIVRDPFEARRVINSGKMAVILGIETSSPFNCKLVNDTPQCGKAEIDAQLDAFHRMGVRSMEIVNKFDNAFGGVAGDSGNAGVLVNTGNKLVTNRYWDFQTCSGEDVDETQTTLPGSGRDGYGAALSLFLPAGQAPVYPPGPHCNVKGLSALGEHLVRRLMERGMLIDPDHLSVLARRQLLNLTESKRYRGVLSSHSWSTPEGYRRIAAAGGLIAPRGGGLGIDNTWARDTAGFIQSLKYVKGIRPGKYLAGLGFGADMGGFAQQNPPRPDAAKNPLAYPFKSFDGAVTLDRQKTGQRTFDLNKDGIAHYGLIPDWIEDMRRIAGPELQEDMARSSEQYLQTWERAVGIGEPGCRSARGKFTKDGLFGLKLARGPEDTLRASGQPATRTGRTWTWCVDGKRNEKARAAATYTPEGKVALVSTNAFGHRAKRVEIGTKAKRLKRKTRSFGRGVLVTRNRKGNKLVYGVRKGKVSFIAVATKSASKSRKTLAGYVKLAGLR